MSRLFEETWRDRTYPTPKNVPFLTPEQFLTAALQAYLAARNSLTPPKGEYWLERVDDGSGRYVAWAGPESFYEELLRELKERVRLHAIKRGDLVRRFYSPAELAEMEAQDRHVDACADALLGASV